MVTEVAGDVDLSCNVVVGKTIAPKKIVERPSIRIENSSLEVFVFSGEGMLHDYHSQMVWFYKKMSSQNLVCLF